MLETHGMPMEAGSDGDSMLWAGLMQAVGDRSSTPGIKLCQTEDGRLWRAPSRVNNQPINSFSRDMALGFILYVQATRDFAMADRWVAYIKATGGLFPASESSDTRHIVTPAIWWLMSYAGIRVPLKYLFTRWLLKYQNLLEIPFTPKGYALHLKAVQTLVLAIHNKKLDKKIGRKLNRLEPQNPFFMWLAGKTTGAIAQNALLETYHTQAPGKGTQWAWQRTDYEAAWCDSMGWDFLFIKLLCRKHIS
jgi:hypothetical protein